MLRRAVTAAFAGLLLVGCGSAPTTPGDTSDSVSLAVQVDLSSFPINQVSVEVTGPGISAPLAFNLTLTEGSASGTIEVPAGSNRVVTVTAFDAAGIATHRGSVTISVDEGENPSVSVTLKALQGDQPIEAHIGTVTVTVELGDVTIKVGEMVQLEATVRGSDGEPLDVQVRWATLNPALAWVDTAGVVTAIGAGEVEVVATYAGVGARTTFVIEPAGLIAHYPLDTSEVTRVGDFLTHFGGKALSFTAGAMGSAVVFDGVSDLLLTAANDRLEVYESGAVSLWIQPEPEALTRSNAVLLSYSTQSSVESAWALIVRDGRLGITWETACCATNATLLSTFAPPVGEWTHVVVTADQNSVPRIYANGRELTLTFSKVEVSEGQDTDWWPQVNGVFSHPHFVALGGLLRDEPLRAPFPGAIDEVRIYRLPLSESEILVLCRLSTECES